MNDLADLELAEKLLEIAYPSGGSRRLASKALQEFGSLAGLLTATESDLCAILGLTNNIIEIIRLIRVSAIKLAKGYVASRPVLENPQRLLEYLIAAMGYERVEQFRTLYFNPANYLLDDFVHGIGTVNEVTVYPREIIRRAIEQHATALILVHNHPSGNPDPSMRDLEMTNQILSVANVFSISLYDHIIVTHGRWFSFREQGLLEGKPAKLQMLVSQEAPRQFSARSLSGGRRMHCLGPDR